MANFDLTLKNLEELFPDGFTQEQLAKGKTILLKELAYDLHKYYGGKMITVPKAGVYGFNWFNIWYTPGVSKISTTIRDNNDASFDLTNRGNLVAVVSDSTRVLGDGDCTPPGGLGVMEGKAFLMKYLGGCDGVALCMDSRNSKGEHDAQKIIDFVKMAEPSFGAINLEDISQPNCYKVLDTLRQECNIPVWHDDAQGTGCVTLAGLINALKIVGKKMSEVKIVFYGAGASNTTIFRLIETDGGDAKNMIMFDTKGTLGPFREDIKSNPAHYRKWEICQKTNPKGVKTMEEAMKGADVLISLSTPGPNVIKPEWIKSMAPKSIVFVCANPVPEIYPYAAKEAGAYIVATGRGDFPNQVNNSLGFPGILKGALMVRAKKITDNMAIAAAHSLADYAEKKALSPDNIIPKMSDAEVFPTEARDVAMQAIKDGVARVKMTAQEAFTKAETDIKEAREITDKMMELGMIKKPPVEMLEAAVKRAVAQIK
ncbi:MAG: malate dehydrogenase [Candidatus Edwardsbacteria bacterium RIFOXYD12_FULL_50_11]|uniref:Malate dehydrogenase n=1 Tax=Candidatus Edwardsbacteria bacterium GWF2_54_11 TaxID=1817851 RepID=A0A1F5R4C8_9BACT|nr:MAG: malate dehydrogenase [Candidatus Edwardsbacteria bacterium RifOxyC12_full_54_24]OGF07316.1 MAG: malate dehydrogenase [Candidatus Edwardsbacteria bacterium RifOxyA12_full_54_48]OGF09310.1 MAG: malate dehydrogenase [Candidatus Edwardsbacteria bacterium GWF2_54_11]OGF09568.1 MAG: malate dehydrogenase [Candidatus Edwardsbacteria bacterium GWE2_54_12]OGF17166.1 MAG: malate dehydrogenase [Candidatus Edwardsbacteria bacterium RIFOXYD12_FULL_50_11]OGJ19745.1 MAG: malate dehydrogenase [Candidat